MATKRGIPQEATLRRERRQSGVLLMAPSDQMPVERIAANPFNPPARAQKLEGLVESIQAAGEIYAPLLLVPVEEWLQVHPEAAGAVEGHEWVAVDGNRRLAAARKLGIGTVPWAQRRMKGDESETQYHTGRNALRLTPLEEAVVIQSVMQRRGFNQQQVADHLGTSQGHVAKRLSLLALPEPVQQAVDAGLVLTTEAVALAASKTTVGEKKVRDDDLIGRVGAKVEEALQSALTEEEEPAVKLSLSALAAAAEADRDRETAERDARARAVELGATYAAKPEDAIAGKVGDHRIHHTDETTIRRAARDRNLLVTPAVARGLSPQFWFLATPAPGEASEPVDGREHRWDALVAATRSMPEDAALLGSVLAEAVLEPYRSKETAQLVRRLSAATPPTGDLASDRVRLAWLTALAQCESRHRAQWNQEWSDATRRYFRVLVDVGGYTLTSSEASQMGLGS